MNHTDSVIRADNLCVSEPLSRQSTTLLLSRSGSRCLTLATIRWPVSVRPLSSVLDIENSLLVPASWHENSVLSGNDTSTGTSTKPTRVSAPEINPFLGNNLVASFLVRSRPQLEGSRPASTSREDSGGADIYDQIFTTLRGLDSLPENRSQHDTAGGVRYYLVS